MRSLPLLACFSLCLNFSAPAFSAPAGESAPDLSAFEVIDGDWSMENGVLRAVADPEAKAVLRQAPPEGPVLCEAQVKLDSEDNQAGLLVRSSGHGEGMNVFDGYYLGIDGRHQQVVWGAMDKGAWREIARKPARVEPGTWYQFRVLAEDNRIKAYVNEIPVAEGRFPKIDGVDNTFSEGAIGLRVLGGTASFRNVSFTPRQPTPPTATYTNPVQSGCADPVVLFHDGTYFAYCTYTPDHPRMVNGIRLYTSKDLAHWEDQGFVTNPNDVWGKSRFWAPDIVEKDGKFYLYYAADERIGVAVADSPYGPFKQEVKKPMLPESIKIDAHVFEDDDGQRYIYYVSFNKGNEIWAAKLNDDMTSVDESSIRLMIRPDQPWEQDMGNVVEGPEVIKHKGIYYLTYSGSHFQSPDYAIGYATATHPLGPWTKYEFNPIMKSTSYAKGTAHHCLTKSPDGSEMIVVYHRHFDLNETEPRQMAIDRIQFVPQAGGPDILEIWGPTSSPQPLPSGSPKN